MQALTYYALYGAKNKFNNRLSDAEIESVTAKELVDKELKKQTTQRKALSTMVPLHLQGSRLSWNFCIKRLQILQKQPSKKKLKQAKQIKIKHSLPITKWYKPKPLEQHEYIQPYPKHYYECILSQTHVVLIKIHIFGCLKQCLGGSTNEPRDWTVYNKQQIVEYVQY